MIARLLAGLLASAAHAAVVVFNPALVEGEVARGKDLRAPYLARFEKNGFVLSYVAARHESTRANPTMALIRRVFEEEKPAFLVIEGVRAGEEAGFLTYARRTCGESACPSGEPAFAALLAEEKGIGFSGGEPRDERIWPAMKKLEYGRRDLSHFYFTRMIPHYRREGRLGEHASSLFAEYATGGYSFEDFQRWYLERNGKAFDLAAFDDDEVAPKKRGPFYTQRLSAAVNVVRNRFALEVVAEKLTAHRNVVIVYGASHFMMERRALARALGEPRMTLSERNEIRTIGTP